MSNRTTGKIQDVITQRPSCNGVTTHGARPCPEETQGSRSASRGPCACAPKMQSHGRHAKIGGGHGDFVRTIMWDAGLKWNGSGRASPSTLQVTPPPPCENNRNSTENQK